MDKRFTEFQPEDLELTPNPFEEFVKAILEAEKLAFAENIKANSIFLNEKYVKIKEFVYQTEHCDPRVVQPMICGLDVYFTADELPDGYSFAVFENTIKPSNTRDNLLVTAGARAAYMHMLGAIDFNNDLEGEDELSEFVSKTIDAYLADSSDENFDSYIETKLLERFGKGR